MILCVDDDPIGLNIRRMFLESQGHHVLTATSGREGLELFAANPVKAVVLDYMMPEMNGGEVASRMKQLKPEVKILLYSAYVDLPAEAVEVVGNGLDRAGRDAQVLVEGRDLALDGAAAGLDLGRGG